MSYATAVPKISQNGCLSTVSSWPLQSTSSLLLFLTELESLPKFRKLAAFGASALEIPRCSSLQRYLHVFFMLQSLGGAARVPKATADVIGEFQREVPLQVNFRPYCRHTPVHLFMGVRLRHRSQAKLRNSYVQGLLRSQVPPFLKKITFGLHRELQWIKGSTSASFSFFQSEVAADHHFSAVFLNCSLANWEQRKQPWCYCYHFQGQQREGMQLRMFS